MAHEHNGNCCDAFQEHHSAHDHALHIGQHCLQGMCAHPEHQGIQQQALMEQALWHHQQDVQTAMSERTIKKDKKKKSKKQVGRVMASWIFASA